MRLLPWIAALSLTAWASSAQAALSPELLAQLQRGGLFLYFRHFDTEGADDARPVIGDCSTQRNLSERGRAQAQATGAALRALKVPVGRLLSGRYCRNSESARLLLGRVTPTAQLDNPYFRDPTAANRALTMRNLRAVLAQPPLAGTNTVIVTHEQLLRLTTGWMLAEGEAAVLRAGRDGTFQVLGRVTPAQFQAAGAARQTGQKR